MSKRPTSQQRMSQQRASQPMMKHYCLPLLIKWATSVLPRPSMGRASHPMATASAEKGSTLKTKTRSYGPRCTSLTRVMTEDTLKPDDSASVTFPLTDSGAPSEVGTASVEGAKESAHLPAESSPPAAKTDTPPRDAEPKAEATADLLGGLMGELDRQAASHPQHAVPPATQPQGDEHTIIPEPTAESTAESTAAPTAEPQIDDEQAAEQPAVDEPKAESMGPKDTEPESTVESRDEPPENKGDDLKDKLLPDVPPTVAQHVDGPPAQVSSADGPSAPAVEEAPAEGKKEDSPANA